MTDYCAVARQYCDDVVSGKVSACKYTIQACERQLGDLEGMDGYTFSPLHANHVCGFVEALPNIKGEWAGEPIRLQPWQVFILTTIFGWLDAEGQRRYKTAYTEVPRKNGKSSISSAVGLYMLAADREGGAEVYSAATTRDQARIVWQDAKRMAERSPGLLKHYGVSTTAHSVLVEKEASVFKSLSRDQGGNLDGLNVHCAIVDELHAHKTRDIWDVLETGTGSRRSPLLWAITTAGFNRAGICYEQRAYALKILAQQVDDPEYFSVIYTLDDGDDWLDPAVWQKANPNWGISVKPDDIARKARKAAEMAAAQNNFLTKHLNVWCNADTAWMEMRAWDACGDESLTIDQFEGQPVIVALDLASKVDIAAMVLVFDIDGTYTVFGKYYLPEDAADRSTNSQYSGWAKEGRLTLTPGAVIDFAYIEDDLRDIASRFEIQEVPYDPFQATQLSTRLMSEGFPMVEMRPTVLNFSEPMKQLESVVLSKQVRHDGCPVLAWMMSNVVCHMDAKDNIYPRKEFPENKIDGVVALIMALGRSIVRQQEGVSVYEDRGLLVL